MLTRMQRPSPAEPVRGRAVAGPSRHPVHGVEILGLALAAGLVWWGRGWLTGAFHAVTGVSPGWLLLAVGAKSLSMASLAREQRRLIGGTSGRRPPMRSVLATAYAGNTISVALPLAGGGLSAAFTFRRYVAGGIPSAQVATGLAVSWALGTSAFTAVLAVAAAGSGQTGLLVTGVLSGLATVAAVAGLLLALQSARVRGWVLSGAERVLPVVQRMVHRPAGDARQLVHSGLDRLAAIRLRRRDLAAAGGFALLVWAGDLGCLAFALRAVSGHLSLPLLVLAWSAGVAATTLSLTPGGLGLVEAALTAALVAAGVRPTTALAGVLGYRLISLWLVGSIGAAILARQRVGARRGFAARRVSGSASGRSGDRRARSAR